MSMYMLYIGRILSFPTLGCSTTVWSKSYSWLEHGWSKKSSKERLFLEAFGGISTRGVWQVMPDVINSVSTRLRLAAGGQRSLPLWRTDASIIDNCKGMWQAETEQPPAPGTGPWNGKQCLRLSTTSLQRLSGNMVSHFESLDHQVFPPSVSWVFPECSLSTGKS